jgi:hypothetical protein
LIKIVNYFKGYKVRKYKWIDDGIMSIRMSNFVQD